VLVLTEGTASFGPDTLAGQWFSETGAALTGEFLALSGAGLTPSVDLELSPLVGGGLALRRITFGPAPTSTWVGLFTSGAASSAPAPAWLASRPNTRLWLVRGKAAYALTPERATAADCTQRLEVVSSAGASCGALDFPIASGPCVTLALTLGLDGTVIQQLPTALESNPSPHQRTCTWRLWPGLLH
jgi:hypothetical protein